LLAINGGLSISGYTANSVILKLWNTSFIPSTGTTDYQIKVIVNYSLTDSSLIGQKINAIMKIHGASGEVVKLFLSLMVLVLTITAQPNY